MRKVFKISGMTCVNCQRTIQIGLKKTKGVEDVDVSLVLERAIVSFDENILSKEDVVKKIKELGYEAQVVEESGVLNLYLDKVDCSTDSCALLTKEDLESLNGVKKAVLDNIKQTLYIEYDKDIISSEDIMAFIRSKGYEASILELDRSKEIVLKIAFGIASGILIMALNYSSIAYKDYIEMVLAIAVQFYTAKDFYKGAIASLKAKTGNMDLLVALGSFVSIVYSSFVVFGLLKGNTFFETPTFLVSFVLIGKLIEYRLKKKASAYLKNLTSLNLRSARVLKGTEEVVVDSYSLKEGDIVLFKAGDRVSLDIIVKEGSAYIDTSFINGEFEPVFVKEGDNVISGSLVKSGYIKGVVVNIAEKSFINELVRASNLSLEKKPNIQRIADTVSSYFVQAIILISSFVFVVWKIIGVPTEEALNYAVSTLVISCPCAMGIAVPISVMVAVSMAFKNGILIKNAASLETLYKADTFVLDKTGTLTEGTFKVVKEDIKEDKEKVCSLIKHAERFSNHPIGKALYEHCKDYNMDINLTCEEIEGFGIKCEDIYITDVSFWDKDINKKAIGIGTKESLMGIFYLEDAISPYAKDFIKSLKQRKKKIILCSGDTENNVKYIADTLGIEYYFASMSPTDKSNLIKRLKDENHIVCMVGDGINDAKAMALSDIGIAVSKALDAAKVSTDIVVSSGGLEKIIYLLDLTDKFMKNVKQNLFWAFGYNAVMIPFAAGIFSKYGIYIEPQFAGLLMGFSSVSVVLNAMRLSKA
ncbi:heavy metal translocating P-type ATPase [Hydrogenobaculum sp. Y04AAS1]|uniref:copper-translocating P-type ATPase n=1 Tax=Hydrogenobaculum sp. (strain Y04AAS1) TaxID=380749 RepID=UPI00015BD105|nr:heavy metal translocating P-type ATPase [Hydrogenobaculum sp. Y04AAS1]HCT66659.1 cadmium-translocating P-type ATPase [Hydrogenobaculum sp.]